MTLEEDQAEMRARMQALKSARSKSRTELPDTKILQTPSAKSASSAEPTTTKSDPKEAPATGPATRKCETCGRHWQRAGRAGRRTGGSCAVFVASSGPAGSIYRAASRLLFRQFTRTWSHSARQSRDSREPSEMRGLRTSHLSRGKIWQCRSTGVM
jgi:hypothetical protein